MPRSSHSGEVLPLRSAVGGHYMPCGFHEVTRERRGDRDGYPLLRASLDGGGARPVASLALARSGDLTPLAARAVGPTDAILAPRLQGQSGLGGEAS